MQKENNTYHFILIDDNEIDLFFHEKMISLQGISSDIKSFSQARKALKYIASFKKNIQDYPNTIILLDIQMPGSDGFDFLQHFEEMPEPLLEKTHIFMVSSSLDYADVNRARAHHLVDKLLKKPLDPGKLKQAINKNKR